MEEIKMNKIKRIEGTIINSNGFYINNNNNSLEKKQMNYLKNQDIKK